MPNSNFMMSKQYFHPRNQTVRKSNFQLWCVCNTWTKEDGTRSYLCLTSFTFVWLVSRISPARNISSTTVYTLQQTLSTNNSQINQLFFFNLVKVEDQVQLADVVKVFVQHLHKVVDSLRMEKFRRVSKRRWRPMFYHFLIPRGSKGCCHWHLHRCKSRGQHT